jgi:glutamate-1-semialdehyde 2,1-aminomutase
MESDPVTEFKTRTTKSFRLYEEAKDLIPGGVNANAKFYAPYPLYAKKAAGSKLIDVDGNEYIDFLLGFGPLILGHGHPEIIDTIHNHFKEFGTSLFGAQDEFMIKLSKKLRELLQNDFLYRYTNSGNEATLNAFRLVKGSTRRMKVAKFEGHYHGWHEYTDVSVSPPLDRAGPELTPKPVPQTKVLPEYILENSIILPFNNIEAVEHIIRENKDELAGVILEPVARGYMIPYHDFLQELREVTEKYDVLLIFDEVVTGFRIGLSGAQGFFGVKPDIVTLGKIVGGGFPIGVVGGRTEILNQFSPEEAQSVDDTIFHSGTFNANSVTISAGLKTLEILQRSGSYTHIEGLAADIRKGISDIIEDYNIDVQISGIGSLFNILFTESSIRNYRDYARADHRKRWLFDLAMYNKGIHLAPQHCSFTSLAHSKEDVDALLTATRKSLKETQT